MGFNLEHIPFGDGIAGKNAKLIVASSKCKNCGEKAVATIDFDVMADLEQLPVCKSTVCYRIMINRITQDLKQYGQIDTVNTFSLNGQGRR